MKPNRLVSVLVPVYNDERYIGLALRSVLTQTYRPIELVICNNGSTDSTSEIIERMLPELGTSLLVRYKKSANCIPMWQNWNRALEEATGEYIKYLCSDDLLEPDCISNFVEILDREETVVLVTSRRVFIDATGEEIQPDFNYRRVVKQDIWEREISKKEMLQKLALFGNFIGEPSTVMFRRSALRFGDHYRQVFDLDYWLNLLSVGNVWIARGRFSRFRMHAGQGTAKNVRKFGLPILFEEVDLLVSHGLDPKNMRTIYAKMIRRINHSIPVSMYGEALVFGYSNHGFVRVSALFSAVAKLVFSRLLRLLPAQSQK
jgi:glycosyltransferase involved in cell wall biosynthesis